tara:strand:+ start:992 stop:1114 length:123 start_codon:yes stop_codon:yes gene_type:complete
LPGGVHERRIALFVAHFDLGAGLQQDPHDVRMAQPRGLLQ